MVKKTKKISQQQKFLKAIEEENCEPIEEFEKKIKKISRVSARASKINNKK